MRLAVCIDGRGGAPAWPRCPTGEARCASLSARCASRRRRRWLRRRARRIVPAPGPAGFRGRGIGLYGLGHLRCPGLNRAHRTVTARRCCVPARYSRAEGDRNQSENRQCAEADPGCGTASRERGGLGSSALSASDAAPDVASGPRIAATSSRNATGSTAAPKANRCLRMPRRRRTRLSPGQALIDAPDVRPRPAHACCEHRPHGEEQ